MQRGFLLPEGCKDLIDVLKLKPRLELLKLPLQVFDFQPKQQQYPALLPAIVGQIVVTEQTTVAKLAALLGRKPFQIIGDLMEIGVFASLHQLLGFEAISKIARKYGFIAIRTGSA